MSDNFAEIRDKLERVRVRRIDVAGALEKMRRDLRAAEHNREVAPEWAVAAAHQAIFSGCAALMAARGYRVRPNGHHKIAIQFARSELPEHSALFDQAELVRRTRHRTMAAHHYGDQRRGGKHAGARAHARGHSQGGGSQDT